MTENEKIKFLENKGFKDNDKVSFNVENQSCYYGPLKGILKLNYTNPYIECFHNGKIVIVSICEGYDAYINTIEKVGE